MNSYNNFDYTKLNKDDIYDTLFLQDIDDFVELSELMVPSSSVNIVEMKDSGCDARFPGESIRFYVNRSEVHDNNTGLAVKGEKVTQSMENLFNPTMCRPEDMKHINKTIKPSQVITMVRFTNHLNGSGSQVLLTQDSQREMINESTHTLTLPKFNMEKAIVNEKVDSSHIKALRMGSEVGKKIANMIKYVKKKLTKTHGELSDDNAIAIVKRVLRENLLENNNTRVSSKDIYPQYYIGASLSQSELFRLGDKWL